MSKFGRVQRELDDNGGVKRVSMYVTQDIQLKKGQVVFFNDIEESLNKDVEFEYITAAQKLEKMAQTRENDEKYNRETLYIAKAGKVREAADKKTL